MTNVERARAYLRAIEQNGDPIAFFAPDVVQTEYPNRLVPSGAVRDLAALEAGRDRGNTVVEEQRYEVTHAVALGDEVALEVLWSAKLKIPIGSLGSGDTMRAHFAVFLTFRDGLIVSQRNYDCFDPF